MRLDSMENARTTRIEDKICSTSESDLPLKEECRADDARMIQDETKMTRIIMGTTLETTPASLAALQNARMREGIMGAML